MVNILAETGSYLGGINLASVYWGLAIFGSIFFGISCVLAIIGVGGLDDGMDIDADGVSMDHVDHGFLDFNLFSIRSILAFLTVFGWGGVMWGGHGVWGFIGAFAAGLATMFLTALVIWGLMKLQSSGTISSKRFIGRTGLVYLGIPGGRNEPGKVTVRLNGSTHELKAVADESIPTGSTVTVAEQLSDSLFLVRKKTAEH
ncbi:MAG: hypothetical protein IJS14_01425 [Lentisphaeria bacterium]|nr:hypothetical protein [Lentisphaeria bacterium]